MARSRTYWTPSSVETWKKCPRRYYYEYLYDGPVVEVPKHPAAERGDRIHKALEDYLRAEKISSDPDVAKVFPQWRPLLDVLRKRGATAEQMWEFDADWHPYNPTGQFPLWVRMKTDAHATKGKQGLVVDYKTGRRYPSHRGQVEIYAIGMFSRYEKLKEVEVALYYIDEGPGRGIEQRTISRDLVPMLARRWRRIADECLRDTLHKPRPSESACRFCPLSAKKGGPCDVGL